MTTKRAYFAILGLLFFQYQIIVWSFPQLEGPDAVYHLSNILHDNHKSLYYLGLNGFARWLGVSKPWLVTNPEFAYGTNQPHYLHHSPNEIPLEVLLSFLATLNVIVAGILLLRQTNSFREEEDRNEAFFVTATFFFWPQVAFNLNSATSSIPVMLLASVVYLSAVKRRRVWLLFLLTLIFAVVFDRNSMVLAGFVAAYGISMWLWPRKVWPVILLGAIAVAGAHVMIHSSYLHLLGSIVVGTVKSSTQYSASPIKAVSVFLTTLYYMSGTVAFTATYPEYIVFAILLIVGTIRARKNVDLMRFIVVFWTAFFITVTFVPQLRQSKYYYFVVPAAVVLIFRDALRLKLNPRNALVVSFLFMLINFVHLAWAVFFSYRVIFP